MRRTQIYLDDEQARRLDRWAASRGTTRSKVIRLAIDEYLMQGDQDASSWRAQWQKAVNSSAGLASYLDTGATYVESIRSGDAARLAEREP